jgi:DNA-binding GntR family transcriptional regulator
MAEHIDIITALKDGDAERGANFLRAHVAVQGQKIHQLIARLKG